MGGIRANGIKTPVSPVKTVRKDRPTGAAAYRSLNGHRFPNPRGDFNVRGA